jgi:hypothetical protein
VTYYILAAQTIHFEFYIEQNKFLPISRDQWELGAETKHYIFGEFYLSTKEQPAQDSVGASGFTLTLRVRLVWLKG